MESKRQWIATNRIKTRTPLNSLFPVDGSMVDKIAWHMQANGYDVSQPIVLWDLTEQENSKHALYVVDGHTRLLAAKKAKLSPVYVAKMKFKDNDEALQYAIHNQRDRRNLTDADLFRCIEAVDKRKQKGERTDLASSGAMSGKSAGETAKIVGTSKTKVERARSVLDHADKRTKEEVLKGEKSIHKAYTETQEKREVKKGKKQDFPDSLEPHFLNLFKYLNTTTNKLEYLTGCLNAMDAKQVRGSIKFLVEFDMARFMKVFSTFCSFFYEDELADKFEIKAIIPTRVKGFDDIRTPAGPWCSGDASEGIKKTSSNLKDAIYSVYSELFDIMDQDKRSRKHKRASKDWALLGERLNDVITDLQSVAFEMQKKAN